MRCIRKNCAETIFTAFWCWIHEVCCLKADIAESEVQVPERLLLWVPASTDPIIAYRLWEIPGAEQVMGSVHTNRIGLGPKCHVNCGHIFFFMLVISERKGCGGRANPEFSYNATLVTRIIAFVNMLSLTLNNAFNTFEWALIVPVETVIVFLPIDMQQHQCAMSWKAHKGEVYSVDFSYDENAVYSIGEDGKVSIELFCA